MEMLNAYYGVTYYRPSYVTFLSLMVHHPVKVARRHKDL